MPQRIQMTRTQPWRAEHPDAVIVDRRTLYGNPISLSDVAGQYPSLDERQVATLVVRDFEVLARRGYLEYPNWRYADGHRGRAKWTYPLLDRIRTELAGRDLACWCDLDMPCHADVLLELANGGDPR